MSEKDLTLTIRPIAEIRNDFFGFFAVFIANFIVNLFFSAAFNNRINVKKLFLISYT
jgi:hypothetical protein